MLIELQFKEDFLPNNTGGISIKEKIIDEKIWIVQEYDLNHPSQSHLKNLFEDAVDNKKEMLVARLIEQGVYEGGFNFNHTLNHTSNYQIVDDYGMINIKDGSYKSTKDLGTNFKGIDWENLSSTYGVADNISQIKNKFSKAIESEKDQYVISVTEVRKDEQSEQGGWRWHKWGQYIGTQDRQCEYLADEKNIESIYCFNIHKVELKKDIQLIAEPNKLKIK